MFYSAVQTFKYLSAQMSHLGGGDVTVIESTKKNANAKPSHLVRLSRTYLIHSHRRQRAGDSSAEEDPVLGLIKYWEKIHADKASIQHSAIASASLQRHRKTETATQSRRNSFWMEQSQNITCKNPIVAAETGTRCSGDAVFSGCNNPSFSGESLTYCRQFLREASSRRADIITAAERTWKHYVLYIIGQQQTAYQRTFDQKRIKGDSMAPTNPSTSELDELMKYLWCENQWMELRVWIRSTHFNNGLSLMNHLSGSDRKQTGNFMKHKKNYYEICRDLGDHTSEAFQNEERKALILAIDTADRLPHNPYLEVLHLHHTLLTPLVASRMLADIGFDHALTSLLLPFCHLTSQTIWPIAEFLGSTGQATLLVLDLSNNLLDASCADLFVEVLPDTILSELSLRNNPLLPKRVQSNLLSTESGKGSGSDDDSSSPTQTGGPQCLRSTSFCNPDELKVVSFFLCCESLRKIDIGFTNLNNTTASAIATVICSTSCAIDQLIVDGAHLRPVVFRNLIEAICRTDRFKIFDAKFSMTYHKVSDKTKTRLKQTLMERNVVMHKNQLVMQ